jgi:hypothetical protein
VQALRWGEDQRSATPQSFTPEAKTSVCTSAAVQRLQAQATVLENWVCDILLGGMAKMERATFMDFAEVRYGML